MNAQDLSSVNYRRLILVSLTNEAMFAPSFKLVGFRKRPAPSYYQRVNDNTALGLRDRL